MKNIKKTIEKTFHNFGFQKLTLPLIASSETFTKRLGPQVKSEMFIFKNQKNQELTLRPEMTSLVVKQFLKEKNLNQNIELPLRLYYSGKIFKQTVNKQEYEQIGTEIIGTNQTYDAENIALAIECIQKLNINNYSITLSNLGILKYLIQNMNSHDGFKSIFFENIKQKEKGLNFIKKNLNENQTTNNNYNEIIDILKKLKPNEEKKLLSSLLRVINPNTETNTEEHNEIIQGILDKVKRQNLNEDVQNIIGFIEKLFLIKQNKQNINTHKEICSQAKKLLNTKNIPTEYIDELEYTIDFLTEYGIPKDNIKIDFSMIRNLNYYTGIVFDININDITVGKGGRYDKLISSFNNKYDIPGFGFIFELEKLQHIIKVNKPKEKIDLYIITNKKKLNTLLNTIKNMRQSNLNVITDITNYNIKEQKIKDLSQKQNTKFILSLNEQENYYSLINTKENQTTTIKENEINKELCKILTDKK